MKETLEESDISLRSRRLALGLRGKMILGVAALLIVIGLTGMVVGDYLISTIREYFGTAFVRDHTLLSRQKLLTLIERELALTKRLAQAEVTRQWMLDENNPRKKARFFREAEGFRRLFRGHLYSVIVHGSGHYYLNDESQPYSTRPRYILSPDNPDDAWYFATWEASPGHTLNVNRDTKLKLTNLWFNVIVTDDSQPIGVASTGLPLSELLADFFASNESGVTNLIVDRAGRVQMHPDPNLIEYSSVSKAHADNTLFKLLGEVPAITLQKAMAELEKTYGGVEVVKLRHNGNHRLYGLSFMPELGWFFVTAVDLDIARLLNERLLLVFALSAMGGVIILVLVVAAWVHRILLAPLMLLTRSVRQVAAGDYQLRLNSTTQDEIGELTRIFAYMTQQVRRHADELEERVQQRTRDLRRANDEMTLAQQKIQESLRYAGMIQTAIFPTRQLAEQVGIEHFILWKPRDAVGGDFVLFHEDRDAYLLGLVDCAGHGVPGAFMTIIAQAAFDSAIKETGIADPAALLSRADAVVRAMLPSRGNLASLATNMDVGLCHIDRREQGLKFAGARLSLYRNGKDGVEEIKGQRRSLGERKRGRFENRCFSLEARQGFYLTTDGLLDQSGGNKGYGFGRRRFIEFMERHSPLSMAAQKAALADCLKAYQGNFPQRDDITVLGFRVP
ncbi:MAG: biofilm regulation protein phosphatase SiaA [Methylohalobius sp. ZOD2]|nr:biofilm regulation protein phosphatase SiaA [Methylothermaceae bacterium]